MRAFELGSVDDALRVCAPDVELTTLLDRLGEPPLHGREGLRLWFERLTKVWGYVELERWDHEDLDGWIVVHGLSRVRGKASPDEFELPWTAIARLGDEGLVDVLALYLTRDEALEAIAQRGPVLSDPTV